MAASTPRGSDEGFSRLDNDVKMPTDDDGDGAIKGFGAAYAFTINVSMTWCERHSYHSLAWAFSTSLVPACWVCPTQLHMLVWWAPPCSSFSSHLCK